MKIQNKEAKAALKALLVALFIVCIQFLAIGLVLAKIYKAPAFEEKGNAHRVPTMESMKDSASPPDHRDHEINGESHNLITSTSSNIRSVLTAP